jgi:hypothetical protein
MFWDLILLPLLCSLLLPSDDAHILVVKLFPNLSIIPSPVGSIGIIHMAFAAASSLDTGP